MASLDIRLFGYPRFIVDGAPVKVERRKTVGLLAYLSAEGMRGVGRDALAGVFWPEHSPEQASAYLRQTLWDFSRSAGDSWLEREANLVRLGPTEDIQVDSEAFEALYGQWKGGDGSQDSAASLLERMVMLYRDDFLAGFSLRDSPAFDEWQSLRSEMLRLHLGHALEALTAIKDSQKEWVAAANHARRWLSLDMLNEAPHRALMRIFDQSGRRSAAIRQYETCRVLLMDELGVEPSAETQALYRQVLERGTPARGATSPARADLSGVARPTGTVTFVFTDIEGSTYLWEHQREAMQHAFDRQEALVRAAMAAHGGYVYKMIGDAFQVAFSTAERALAAVLSAQRALHAEQWGNTIGELRVRMAVHAGVTEERGDDYVGPALNRVARLLSTGYGGQVLVSQAVYDLVRENIPGGINLRYLGEYHLKDLVQPEHVFQLEADGLPATFPPLKALDNRVVKLPTQSTPFIGREVELANIQAMLIDPECRLITLLGIGGSGKTRLAIRAGEVSQGFKDGVCFVALAQVNSMEDIVSAIADAINLHLTAAPRAGLSLDAACKLLFQYLSGKSMLLLLDNFEHLTNHAQLVGDLLDAAPAVKVIATSRQRLNLPGEWVLELGGLSFPTSVEEIKLERYAAFELFLKTAERNSGELPATANWPAIMRICQQVEGIPLGIEMAAAWTRMLTCQEIAAEIEQNLDFLSASWRGMPERHRTLRAVFEHSWNLLSEMERTVFSKLSIFQGGFTREVALQVAGATLPVLSDFHERSFIRRFSSGRYEIHPLLGRYASEKLAASETLFTETRLRKVAYFSDWLAAMFEKLKGKEYVTALISIRGEVKNLIDVLTCMIERVDMDGLRRMLPACILYHVMNDRRLEMIRISRLFIQLIERLRPLAQQGDLDATSLLALALAAARYFTIDYQHLQGSQPLFEESLQYTEKAPENNDKAYALLLNSIGPVSDQADQAEQRCAHSADLFHRLGDAWGVAMAHLVIGDILCFVKAKDEQARTAYGVSFAGFGRLNCDWGRALCMFGQMHLERRAGKTDEAYRLAVESLDIYNQMGSVERLVPIRHFMAELDMEKGNLDVAHALYEANLAHFIQRGDAGAQSFYRRLLERIENGVGGASL